MEAVDGPVAALQDALATALGIVWEEPELAFADAVAALDVADDIRILLLDGDADALWDLAKLLNEERTAPRHSPNRRR